LLEVHSELPQKALVIMGSNSDLVFSQKIKEALAQFSIPCDLRIASAHRTPEYLLRILREYSASGDQIVAITVAGLSDALSGVVAAQRLFPVISCPPDLEKYEFPKLFSSAFTPSDVPVAFINEPAKAANFVAQVFALTDTKLREQIASKFEEKKRQLETLDKEAQGR
jgi:phosphoribosylaminoimidazole carboxylase PurE protein